ncbi:MAG: sigma-70 family RNA polymerase sigma factor [Planctomycetaceae bacterium]|nr:sigma-70 family RNA polymerase sigma factor [Planctomycetaceae bacterium]
MTAPVEDRSTGGSTSRSLLADAKLADPAAWERLVRLYAPLVASWCRRWGVAEQDVADLLQDVFSAVAGHLHRFHSERPADTFRGWLSTIARNKVRDHYRRRLREPDAAGGSEASRQFQHIPDADISENSSATESPTDAGDEILLNDLLRNALESIRGEFHERTWRAFWGVVVDGRTAAEVAHELDMKPGTVRVAKSRILLRLRRELGDVPT